MPVHPKRLTDSAAKSIAPPAAGYELHWCPGTAGFGLRVTAAGARAWVAERRVDGKTVRRTLGRAQGCAGWAAATAITAEAARRLQVDVSSELQQGNDRLEVRRAQRTADKIKGLTFAEALRQYVKAKRRTKDGLPLKARTVADYLAMIEPAGETKGKRATLAGELHDLAERPLHRITGDHIRKLHATLAPRGERRQTYGMQVLRAVMRHHGVKVDDDPLSPATAGAARVRLAPSRGKPTPIPPERLGAWWRAACALEGVSADQLRFTLLTGCRPAEAAGLLIRDVDQHGGRAVLRDTKNRSDHTIVMSKQAATIVKRNAAGKTAGVPVFGVADAGKTLATINATAGVVGVTQHKLRHTFASVAAELVPAYTLRRLLNHVGGTDVAANHYVGVSEAQLRAGWQAIADFVETAP